MTTFKFFAEESKGLITLGFEKPLKTFFSEYNITSKEESQEEYFKYVSQGGRRKSARIYLEGNFDLLAEALFNKIGYKLVPVKGFSSDDNHAEMIANKTMPFSTEEDHDLANHLFSILTARKNIKTLFEQISKVEQPSCRGNLFEYVSFLLLNKLNNYENFSPDQKEKVTSFLIKFIDNATLNSLSNYHGLEDTEGNKKIVSEYRIFLRAVMDYLISDEEDFTFSMKFSNIGTAIFRDKPL